MKTTKYTLKLRSVGNPDFRQYAPISDPKVVECETLKACSEAARAYIREWDLGGGNWPITRIYQGKKAVARVSYNGRIWDMDENEIII